ncbi:hypothetical protein CIW50_22420 [Tardiphaga sp. P9-11]|jgi:hypothetical protein|nr:hypothetical protein CIW50_22420 [Tardiphaga sp. P9-11]
MSAAFVFLLYCGLIGSVPALLFFQGAVAGGIVSIVAAVCTIIVAATNLFGDHPRLPRLVSPVILAGLAGALLIMLLQIVPMPGGPLMNPIWSSAAAALGEKPSGSVTIDTGMTMLAICRLTCTVAVGLLAVLIGQHRRRAEMLLSALAGIATLVSLERIASSFSLPEPFPFLPPAAQSAAETISIFGFVLTAAAIVRGYERSRPSRSQSRKPVATAAIETAATLAASLINLAAVVLSGDPVALFAALFGAGLLLAVLVIRKGRLGSWGQAGTAAVLALALSTFIAFMPGRVESELIIRMTDDARPLGVGAGTLAALAPIYGDWPEAPAVGTSAAATVTIEMGRPFLWLIVLIAATWAALLLRGALQRGRDFVYSAAGAGCIAALLISASSTGGGLSLASSVILSATLGLAVAQSKGETSSASAVSAPRQWREPRSFKWRPYGALVVLALFLAAHGAWVLLPEVSRPAQIGLPSDQRHATVARQDQERANRSAVLAVVRGDLWAESAFTYASMLWTDQALELEESGDRSARTSTSLLKTLHYAPHRGDAWLMLASTCERLKMQACNVGALLKMSYYTAPDRAGLLPLRLAQALRSKDIGGDDELADMARRDIRFVLARSPDLRPALIAAYRSASSAGKRLVEQTVTPVDPGYLIVLRAKLT